MLSLYEIGDNDNNSYVLYFVNRFQTVVQLFAGRGSSFESGRYCCEIPDEYELNQTLCINLGKNACLVAITKLMLQSIFGLDQLLMMSIILIIMVSIKLSQMRYVFTINILLE